MGVTGKSNITDFNEYKLSRERSISKKKVVHGSFDSDFMTYTLVVTENTNENVENVEKKQRKNQKTA